MSLAVPAKKAEDDELLLQLRYPEKFRGWNAPMRYKVAYGGRGSAKSWTIGRKLIIKSLEAPRLILCTREFQNSIKNSVHRLLKNQIEMLGLRRWFNITDKSITSKAGSEFIFYGLKHNIESIQSLEGVSICWVEEGHTASEESLRVLFPTIREPDSEIWISFNPKKPSDSVYQRFVENTPENCHLVNINWNDNPFFNETLREERKQDYRINEAVARHIWEGSFLQNEERAIWLDSDFGTYQNVPRLQSAAIFADTASEDSVDADFSVLVYGGFDYGGNFVVVDAEYGKWKFQQLFKQATEFWERHRQPKGDTMIPAQMFIEDASSGKQLVQLLSNTAVNAQPIRRKVPVKELIGPPQESRKWKRSSQAMMHLRGKKSGAFSEGGKILLPSGPGVHSDAKWIPEFKRQLQSIEMLSCGNETGYPKVGTWDFPDAVADAIYHLDIAADQNFMSAMFLHA